VVLTSQSYD